MSESYNRLHPCLRVALALIVSYHVRVMALKFPLKQPVDSLGGMLCHAMFCNFAHLRLARARCL